MVAPVIVPNIEYGLIDGQVVSIVLDAQAGVGAGAVMTMELAAGDPKIDIRIGHPVLCMGFITNETDTTGSQAHQPADEMERGTAPDSGDEWQITDQDTVTRWATVDQNGFGFITYIAFGGRKI